MSTLSDFIANNLTETLFGKILDARQGKFLDEHKFNYESTFGSGDYNDFNNITLEDGIYSLQGGYFLVINDFLEGVKVGVLQEVHLAESSIQLRYVTINDGVPTYGDWNTIAIVVGGLISAKNLMAGNTAYAELDTLTAPGFYRVPDHAVTGTNETRSPIFISQYKKVGVSTVYTSQKLFTKTGEIFSRNNESGSWSSWTSNFRNDLNSSNAGYALDSRQGAVLLGMLSGKVTRSSAPFMNVDNSFASPSKALLEQCMSFGIALIDTNFDGGYYPNVQFIQSIGGNFNACTLDGGFFLNVSRMSFMGCGLTGAYFQGGVIQNINGCNLNGVTFSQVDLTGNQFQYSGFNGSTYFQNCNLKNANFEGCNLTNIPYMPDFLMGSRLELTYFTQCYGQNANINVALSADGNSHPEWISVFWTDDNLYNFNNTTKLWVLA